MKSIRSILAMLGIIVAGIPIVLILLFAMGEAIRQAGGIDPKEWLMAGIMLIIFISVIYWFVWSLSHVGTIIKNKRRIK